jgi:DNA-directed RNA polymerase subunit delta
MKRIIVDYSKLTNEILNLLVEKFPDGYDDSDIIRFKNHKNEAIEAVEVKTEDTIFLVKISTKLSDRIINFDDDDDDVVVPLEGIKGIEMDEEDLGIDDDDDDDEIDSFDKPDVDNGDDEDSDEESSDITDDEDEDDED